MLYERYPQLDARLLSYPGARRDYQPVWMWDRYLVADRMYAGLLYIGAHKDPRYANHPFLSIKIDPAEGGVLLCAVPGHRAAGVLLRQAHLGEHPAGRVSARG